MGHTDINSPAQFPKMREPGFRSTVLLSPSGSMSQRPWQGFSEMELNAADGLWGSSCPFSSEKLYLSLFCRIGSYLRFPLKEGSAAKTKRLKTTGPNNSRI